MRRLNAVLFALMMATLSLAGCLGGDDGGGSDEEPADTLEDWTVYMVDSGDDLPNCNSDSLGRLYYVADVDTFEVCLTTGWSFIDIKGADGAQGPAGEQGPQGERGMDGKPANDTMMYDLEQQLLVMNQDMNVLLSNISQIESELGSVDNTIQLYYSWFTQINFDVIDLQYNLSMVWDAIFTLESNLANATSCQLVPYAYCAGADLSYMDLSGMDLTGIDLRGANLQNTTFDYATLDGADLRSIVAMNATFIHAGMNKTYLQNAEFNRYNSGCLGNSGYCSEANLTYANLVDADLTNANLYSVDMRNADLWRVDLTDAYLYNANLAFAGMNFADLVDADLTGANLSGADLYSADLTDANLWFAVMIYTDLRYADLTNAYFGDATVTNSNFYRTTWSNTVWTDGVAYDTNQA